jgi:hypothetical protein
VCVYIYQLQEAKDYHYLHDYDTMLAMPSHSSEVAVHYPEKEDTPLLMSSCNWLPKTR